MLLPCCSGVVIDCGENGRVVDCSEDCDCSSCRVARAFDLSTVNDAGEDFDLERADQAIARDR